MKLSQSKDLSPLRERAREAATRELAVATRTPLGAVFAIKLAAARAWIASGEPSQLLADESEIRGMSIDDLASLITARAAEADGALVLAEIDRQRKLLAIDAATTERELMRIIGAPDQINPKEMFGG